MLYLQHLFLRRDGGRRTILRVADVKELVRDGIGKLILAHPRIDGSQRLGIANKGYTFFGDVQGPWYTVGYKWM